MGLWEWLDGIGKRREARRIRAEQHLRPRRIDARGWIGIGVYGMVLIVLGLVALVPDLRKDEFFKTIATLIVGAFIKDVVGWAYAATQAGGEMASRNQKIIEAQAANNPPIADGKS